MTGGAPYRVMTKDGVWRAVRVIQSVEDMPHNFKRLHLYSWNAFRYTGDCLHLAGIAVLLATILRNKSVAGASRSTHLLRCLVFLARYFDLFLHAQAAYLVVFKVVYLASSIAVLALFARLDATYERRHDTCNLSVIVAPCAVAALLLTSEHSVGEVLWTFSEHVEGFALLPQYVFCYRRGRGWGTDCAAALLGAYRACYALSWAYKSRRVPYFYYAESRLARLGEVALFLDFLAGRLAGRSVLRSAVLAADSKVSEVCDRAELKASRKECIEMEGGEVRRRRADGNPMQDV